MQNYHTAIAAAQYGSPCCSIHIPFNIIDGILLYRHNLHYRMFRQPPVTVCSSAAATVISNEFYLCSSCRKFLTGVDAKGIQRQNRRM